MPRKPVSGLEHRFEASAGGAPVIEKGAVSPGCGRRNPKPQLSNR